MLTQLIMKTDTEMIFVEIKVSLGEALGMQFTQETWQEISDHCLDHDPLPWCTE